MKKINLLLLMLMMGAYAFGQSFVITRADTAIWGPVTTQESGTATVKNISGLSKSVKCKRTIIHLDSGNFNYFCWASICFSRLTDVSPISATIAGGDSSTSFTGYCSDSALPGANPVLYTFFDSNNASDSVSVLVTYYFGASDINEVSASNMLFNAYPNAANNQATIQYLISKDIHSAQLVLMNILGSKVGEYYLDTKNNSITIPTSNLSNGIYFYSLEEDGKIISTRKLLVAH